MYVDEAAAVAEFKIRMTTKSLVLKRGSASRQSGQWRDDDCDVLKNGVDYRAVLIVPIAPAERPWMWASDHNGDIGYEPTREAAMAAFAKSWRRWELSVLAPQWSVNPTVV
jgi:hypothetical protein